MSKAAKKYLILLSIGIFIITIVFGLYLICNKINLNKNIFDTVLIVILYAVSILIYFVSTYMLTVKKTELHKVFLICGFILSILFGIVFPAGAVEDETMHISNTYLLSNRIMGIENTISENQQEKQEVYYDYRSEQYFIHRSDRDSTVYKFYDTYIEENTADKWNEYVTQSPETWKTKTILSGLVDKAENNRLVPIRLKDHNVSVISYIPAVVGVTIARVFNLSFSWQLILGSMFMSIVYVLCTAWAVWRIPIWKHSVFTAGILPMSLYLSFSFSYDSVILSIVFMLFAQIIHISFSDTKAYNLKNIIILCLILFLIGGLKFGAYASVILIIFLMPKEKYSVKKKLILFIISLTVIMVGIIINNSESIISIFTNAEKNAVSALGKETNAVTDIFKKPMTFIKAIFNTSLRNAVNNWMPSCIGINLNWLRIEVDKWIIIGIVCCIILSFLNYEDRYINIGKRIIMFLPIVVTALFFMTGMYFWETEKGADTITGMQGRYFTPLVPLGIASFSGIKINKLKIEPKHYIPPIMILDIFVLLNSVCIIIK